MLADRSVHVPARQCDPIENRSCGRSAGGLVQAMWCVHLASETTVSHDSDFVMSCDTV